MSAPRYQPAARAEDQHARGWAGLGFPAAVAPPVSSGPSKGERAWRPRRRHGTNAPPAYRPNQRQAEVAE
jgi:hypothetical protein